MGGVPNTGAGGGTSVEKAGAACNGKAGASAADKLYREISVGKKHPVQELFHRIIFSAGIKPFVKKKGGLYKGVTDKWAGIGI